MPADQIGNIYQLGPQISKFFPNFMPGFDVNGGFQGFTASTPSLQPYDTLEAADDLSLSHGAHQFSFGMDYINLRAFATNYLLNQGQFTFDGNRTDLLAVSSRELGPGRLFAWPHVRRDWLQPGRSNPLQAAPECLFCLCTRLLEGHTKIDRQCSAFVGIHFSATPTQLVTWLTSLSRISLTTCTALSSPRPRLAISFRGIPVARGTTSSRQTRWTNGVPRFGVAWDPKGDGRMVVRAGIGLFWDFPNFSYDQFGFEEPYGGAVNNPGGTCTANCITIPGARCRGRKILFQFTDQQGNLHNGENPFPQFVGQGPTQSAYLPGALVFSYPPFTQGVKPTSVLQYNLTVEQQVGKNWVFSVGYVGSQQRHLWGNDETNPGMQGPCPPGYPFPSGVNCTSAGGKVPNGPCPTTFFGSALPPFVCPAIFGARRLAGKQPHASALWLTMRGCTLLYFLLR